MEDLKKLDRYYSNKIKNIQKLIYPFLVYIWPYGLIVLVLAMAAGMLGWTMVVRMLIGAIIIPAAVLGVLTVVFTYYVHEQEQLWREDGSLK